MTTDKEELAGKLNETDIKEVKTRLNQLVDQKKTLISQRKAIGKQIAEGINKIKTFKEQRDAFTKAVQENKEKREVLNKKITAQIGTVKDTKVKRVPREKGESPRELQKEKDRLEYTLETEALSFEKEKKMMKLINEIKKKLESIQGSKAAFAAVGETNKEIKGLKEEADAIHKIIQEKAKASQEKHEEMIKVSKEVDKLKKEEKKLNKQIDEKKKEIDTMNKEFGDKLKPIKEAKEKRAQEQKAEESKKQKKMEKTLADKRQEVEDKMARGEKLTTEDILILQGSE